MSPKRYRWVCPRCDSGKLASSRPKRRAIVRYCLPCSENVGELVERRCPALDRKRDAKADARAAKSKRDRATKRRTDKARKQRNAARRAERHAGALDAAGDLRPELERLWGLAQRLSSRDDLDKLPVFQQRHRSDGWVSGVAYCDPKRIVVSVGTKADVAAAYGTVAHEVAHLAVPDSEHHGPGFWAFLVDLVREAYGAEVDLSKQSTKWGRQQIVEQALRDAREAQGL